MTKLCRFAVVEELAELGATIHTCSRNAAQLNERLQEWASKGLKVTGSVCDVSSRELREQLMQKVSSVFDGKLNILVSIHNHVKSRLVFRICVFDGCNCLVILFYL